MELAIAGYEQINRSFRRICRKLLQEKTNQKGRSFGREVDP
jgi:hypothetical protein